MDAKDGLEFVEKLVYDQTGKYLTDLERDIFIGSWNGQTYEEIYPTNPEYVEKLVGYKLWRKLSTILGEKVSKKKIRGAVERSRQRHLTSTLTVTDSFQPKNIFISYRNQNPDRTLAQQLSQAIAAAGQRVTMTDELGREQDWLTQMNASLHQCDYFVLLLSPQAAVSEMVIEELRQAMRLHANRQQRMPLIMPIRVNCQSDVALNHDLRTYLQDSPQLDWQSSQDTEAILEAVLGCIQGDRAWGDEARKTRGYGDTGTRGQRESLEIVLPSPLSAPSPVADPELPQGQVRLDSAFYIERIPVETRCYREILQPGTLIRIKAPRQMGKTSLMSRILHHAREQGYCTVPLSFQHADAHVFSSLDSLLQWFCLKVGRKLRLSHSVEHHWSTTFGSKDNCTAYFEDCVLSEIDSPLVLGLDEIDRIFQYPTIADDFFGLLRAWYEEAGYGDSYSGLWEKLRLIVVHSTEVYIPLDVNQSPFNVGLPIELLEFSLEQVLDLSQRHGLNWTVSQVEQLMAIVGGHPYLIRLALYHLVQQFLTLSDLITSAPTESGIYGDHLRRHLWNLQQHPELASAFEQVIVSDEPVELPSIIAFKLHSLGLVELRGNYVMPRFELYRQYFRVGRK